MRNAVHGLYKKAAEAVLPPLSKSQFDEKRVLTPEEFVAAGDYLTRACPTWSWEAGDVKKAKSFLPPGKQYLVTRNVPCFTRASTVEGYDPQTEFALHGDEEGWVATHADPDAQHSGGGARGRSDEDDAIPSIDDAEAGGSSAQRGPVDDDDIPDISDLELQDGDDEAAARVGGEGGPLGADPAESAESALLRTRTYDLYITYDQYYQVPRIWLVGYDEARSPLSSQQVLQDVSEEHAKKTITVDPHPHLALSAASIHPCRHADVMKKLADNLLEAGREFRVDQYLVLFLKFIASVVPTIQYDYTMSVGGE